MIAVLSGRPDIRGQAVPDVRQKPPQAADADAGPGKARHVGVDGIVPGGPVVGGQQVGQGFPSPQTLPGVVVAEGRAPGVIVGGEPFQGGGRVGVFRDSAAVGPGQMADDGLCGVHSFFLRYYVGKQLLPYLIYQRNSQTIKFCTKIFSNILVVTVNIHFWAYSNSENTENMGMKDSR